MSEPRVTEVGQGRLLLDLGFRDHEGLIAAYLVPGPAGWTLIETGPTTCRDSLLRGVADAGVDPQDVTTVLVTHVHLDHAGGVGALADRFPRARFGVHERGLPHLADPSRLAASARRAWGSAADTLWGTIVPTPVSRLWALSGGERVPATGGDLEVLATPGHASHHLSFWDPATHGLFVGDSAGVEVAGGWRARPAVPPPDLDLERLNASLDLMLSREPRAIHYSHFGTQPEAIDRLHRYRATVQEWVDVALEVARSHRDVEAIARALEQHERAAASSAGASAPSEDAGALVSGYSLAAQGLLRYFETYGLLEG